MKLCIISKTSHLNIWNNDFQDVFHRTNCIVFREFLIFGEIESQYISREHLQGQNECQFRKTLRYKKILIPNYITPVLAAPH